MDVQFDTRTLILFGHAVVAVLLFGYAGLTLASGETAAAIVRLALATLVLGLGVSLYWVRGKQDGR